jgi:hypothetical protein
MLKCRGERQIGAEKGSVTPRRRKGWSRTLLQKLYARLQSSADGSLVSYIPELATARSEWFGLIVATVDSRVYVPVIVSCCSPSSRCQNPSSIRWPFQTEASMRCANASALNPPATHSTPAPVTIGGSHRECLTAASSLRSNAAGSTGATSPVSVACISTRAATDQAGGHRWFVPVPFDRALGAS